MWPRVVALLACTSALRPHTHAPPRRRAVALRAGEFVPVGAVRAGEVTRVESYGCFVKLDDGGARASGAGGQNVNKVSTKAELRFSVDDSKLPPAVRAQLRATHAARLTKNNELLVVSEAHRTQRLNAADALARLQAFVDAAASAAAPRARPDKALRIGPRAAERKRRTGSGARPRRRPPGAR
ncbi:translation release factor [Aureococcus anophagefferens]|nr:translation release factor [Aureococcus anophagefferens]